IVSRRLGRKVIGFGNSVNRDEVATRGELLAQANVEDVMEFGLIPELLGRLPVVGTLAPLDEQALVRVLTEPRNALVRQYHKLFEMEECELEFSDSALHAIARLARERETGARGLRSILEGVMFDLMFELPEMDRGQKFVITEEHVYRDRQANGNDSAAA
ncbi:MAG: ATP-dependent Clp protease ATP-binding subunit ClpX, partial [Planctomycetaceae bacterium]